MALQGTVVVGGGAVLVGGGTTVVVGGPLVVGGGVTPAFRRPQVQHAPNPSIISSNAPLLTHPGAPDMGTEWFIGAGDPGVFVRYIACQKKQSVAEFSNSVMVSSSSK